MKRLELENWFSRLFLTYQNRRHLQNNVNQYEKALLSDRYMRRSNAQMDQWSILSDNIIYVKSKDSDIMNGIDIKLIDYRET